MAIIDRVKEYCGVKSTDVNLSDNDFDSAIGGYIESVEDWLTTYLGQNYETYPAGIEQIIVEIVSNILRNQVIRKGVSMVSTESEESSNYVEREITDDIKQRLKPYIKRSRIRVFGV